MQESINNPSMLKVGTILRGTYRIESYLSSGGFGNTYVATNIEFEERVAIKEFFMKGVTQREDNQTTVSVSNTENQDSFLEQKEKFKKEARRIRQLKNEHIVTVHDLFEENGTAYYVMDYVDGENLSARLKRTGKPMSEEEVDKILPQILDALQTVHDAGIWHLDLKPANIMVDKAGNVKLIDFGASKQLNTQKGGATTSTAISYTNGYAPREQMEQNYDKFGPWTDIYALGATLYNLLTNKRPPLPTDIDDDATADKHIVFPFPDSVSGEMKSLVLLMMKTNRLLRPQSIDEIIHGEKFAHKIDVQDSFNQQIGDIDTNPTANMEEETIISPSNKGNSITEQQAISEHIDESEQLKLTPKRDFPLCAKLVYAISALYLIFIIISTISNIKFDLEVKTAVPELKAEKQIPILFATIVVLSYGIYIVYKRKTNFVYATCLYFLVNIIDRVYIMFRNWDGIVDFSYLSIELINITIHLVMGIYLLKSKIIAEIIPTQDRNLKVVDVVITAAFLSFSIL